MIYEKANVNDILPDIRKILKEETVKKNIKGNFETEHNINALKKGLLLKGITGCGKTHTLYAVRSVVRHWGQPCTKVENWVKLLFELKKDNFSKVNVIIEDIVKSDFIFIDDIGAEKASEWSEEMLYLIINEAYINEKILFVSTNLDDKEFTSKYGNRIASRLGEMCIPITMPDKDWRD